MGLRDQINRAWEAFFTDPIQVDLPEPHVEGSIQSRMDPAREVTSAGSVSTIFYHLQRFAAAAEEVPPWGDPTRDAYLSEIWHDEPILAGAMYSMVARMTSLGWKLTGPKGLVREYYDILQDADGGNGWSTFMEKECLDFLCKDRGMFVEFGKNEVGGYTTGLYSLDALRCETTGHPEFPVIYWDPGAKKNTRRGYALRYDEVFHRASLTSSKEDNTGARNLGFSAVSRALRSAKLLMQLHKYKEEKLSDLPPAGISTITGMTKEQVDDAFALYAANREQKGQLTFPGILWLVGNDIGSQIKVELIPFASLPDNFSELDAVEIYAKTLALAFGVDVGEFWQIEHSGATKASAWIQALKAKGKGPGEISAIFARMMRTHVLPPSVSFGFEAYDSEEAKNEVQTLHTLARFVRILSATQQQTGIITRDEARRILAERGAIPLDMAESASFYLTDVGEKAGEPIITKNSKGDEFMVWSPDQRRVVEETKHELSVGDDGVVNIWVHKPEPVGLLTEGQR